MKDLGPIDLSIVIPTLNEGDNIQNLIGRIHTVLEGKGISYEVLVVDGGSRDATPELAAKAGAMVIRQRLPGFGQALSEGFDSARGRYVLTMDADYSHDPWVILDLYSVRNEARLVIASRYVKHGYTEADLFRNLLSRVLNRIYSWVLSLPIKDLSSGFRLYECQALKDIKIESRSFEVQQEILIKMYGLGYKIKEVPFHYRMRFKGYSKARIIRFGIRLLKMLYRMWRLRNSSWWADYDDRAFDSRIPPQRIWQRAKYRLITRLLGPAPPRILDVGCGSYKLVQGIPQAIGLDVAINKLRFLRQLNRKLVQGSVFALPFPDNSFDAVVFTEVIEHLADKPQIFQELYRVLSPGGTLIISTPDYSRYSWLFLETAYEAVLPGAYAHEHTNKYTYKRLISKLREYRFYPERCLYLYGSDLILRARKVL